MASKDASADLVSIWCRLADEQARLEVIISCYNQNQVPTETRTQFSGWEIQPNVSGWHSSQKTPVPFPSPWKRRRGLIWHLLSRLIASCSLVGASMS